MWTAKHILKLAKRANFSLILTGAQGTKWNAIISKVEVTEVHAAVLTIDSTCEIVGAFFPAGNPGMKEWILIVVPI